jgi:hypothetical protein
MPRYGHAHERLRKAVLESGIWIGRPCYRCGKPMWPGMPLDLDHLTDENGVRVGDDIYVPGYLSHRSCNQRHNAFAWRSRRAALADKPQESPAAVRRRVAAQRAKDADAGRDW